VSVFCRAEKMFDSRKFWLGTAMYVLIFGAVIAVVGAAFSALVGMPTKEYPQVVTQTEPNQGGKVVPVANEREAMAPSAIPLPPLIHRTPATNVAGAMAPPQTFGREIQIIVPEPKSTRRSGSSGLGF
jgi:hypothetical protein